MCRVHNFQDDGLDLQVEVMWALTDFTVRRPCQPSVARPFQPFCCPMASVPPVWSSSPWESTHPSLLNQRRLNERWLLYCCQEDNGATHAVLGSHREEPRDGPLGFKQPTVQAVMPKGSVVVWTGEHPPHGSLYMYTLFDWRA
eukprot:COSAG04_NODE_3484_length_2779_cov_18.460448_1_plen_143_part_00